MISETEVKYMISSEIPALAVDLSMIKNDADIYKSIGCLTDYTKDLIKDNKMDEVQSSFKTAYELLHNGSAIIRSAVVNIYISAISRIVEANRPDSNKVKPAFLNIFGKEYHQLHYAHCI